MTQGLPQVYNFSMYADFYLSVYNNNRKIWHGMAGPIISLLQPFVWIYSQHDPMSAVLPLSANSFIEEQ